jgi:hypothetical protein
VPVDGTGTASVEAVKAPPVPGVQKSPHRVGKQFRGRLVMAPKKKKVKKPAGLKRDLLGCGRTAWARARQSAAAAQAARHGVRCRAGLKAADSNHLVQRFDSDGEGAGAAAQDRVGAVVERLKGWNHAAPTDPDEGDGEQLGWQLAGQVGAKIVQRQRRSRNMQSFGKFFDNSVN